MKKYILILAIGVISLTNCVNAQTPNNTFTAESIISFAKEHVDTLQWSLETLFLRINTDSAQTKALLVAHFLSISGSNESKTYGYGFDEDAAGGLFIVNGGNVTHTCSGVNCSNCDVNGTWDISCECEIIGHEDGGPSYCNHTITTKISNYSGYKLEAYATTLDAANALLQN